MIPTLFFYNFSDNLSLYFVEVNCNRSNKTKNVVTDLSDITLPVLPPFLSQAAIALIMVIPSDIGSLIDFFSFTAWIFYGGSMVALLLLRYTMKDVHRPYKVSCVCTCSVLVCKCGYMSKTSHYQYKMCTHITA